MKRFLLLVFFTSCFISGFSSINLLVDYATFHIPGEKSYIEFYLNINGNSLTYKKNENEKLQSRVEITYLIEEGPTVVAYDKFQLNSPEYGNGDVILDLMDLKRIPIENGEFSFTIIAKDLISGEQVETSSELRPVNFSDEEITFSEIQLANNAKASSDDNPFVKNGVDITPNLEHFFNASQDEQFFYIELYNSNLLGDTSDFLIQYSIVEKETGEVSSNLNSFKRLSPQQIIPLLQSFKLNDLPSGKYVLKVEAKDRNNKVLAEQSIEFVQRNPDLIDFSAIDAEDTFVDSLTNKKELGEYIRSLKPISSAAEIQFAINQLQYAELEFMQQYFLNFWKTRNAEKPEQEWLKYKAEVEKVDREFGYGGVKGYQTDRGRVYLKYGPPSSLQNVPYDRDTYPYSIWQYNQLEGQSNRKFVFYSPTMEMLGYEVLHSNVRGEYFNPNWEAQLIYKTEGSIMRNTNDVPEGTIINERARDLFDNPR